MARYLPETGFIPWVRPTARPIVAPETIPDPRPLLYDADWVPLAPPPRAPVGFAPPVRSHDRPSAPGGPAALQGSPVRPTGPSGGPLAPPGGPEGATGSQDAKEGQLVIRFDRREMEFPYPIRGNR